MKYDNIQLIIPEKIKKNMEEKLILEENMKEVIYKAETTGKKIINLNNNHITAYFKPKIITYWVEYTKQGSEYLIHSTYSHRIQIIDEYTSD